MYIPYFSIETNLELKKHPALTSILLRCYRIVFVTVNPNLEIVDATSFEPRLFIY